MKGTQKNKRAPSRSSRREKRRRRRRNLRGPDKVAGLSIPFGDGSITSQSGRYSFLGTGKPLVCNNCQGSQWKVQSVAMGGRLADALGFDALTDRKYFLYTCERCTEVRTMGSPLSAG